jgi:hypothetical protein
MPSLVYPSGDFQPFTKILSSEVNGKFNAIKTLLNTTKLDYSNFQLTAMVSATQTSVQVAVTDTLGVLSLTQFLPSVNGGFGFSFTPTTLQIAKVLQVNNSGSALTFDAVPSAPGSKIYNFYRFG